MAVKRAGKPLCDSCTREILLEGGKRVRCEDNNLRTCPFYKPVKVYPFPTEVK
jgi:hypothetical protein